MDRNLGAFTCYGIEYVFDYLGENRIKLRIQELEEKPTGSMGISLKDFTYCDAENSYFSGKGILWTFNLLIQWFEDIEFIKFLYESSKKYNEDNYHNGGLIKKNWHKHIENLNQLLVDDENSVYLEVNKLNPYCMEYHFFYMQLSKSIKKAFKKIKELELDLIGSYELNKNKLTGRILLEIKTRRKPLSGQYLFYREGFVWFDLEPIEVNDNFSIFQFIKDKNLYNLILGGKKLVARIELTKSSPYSAEYISVLQNIKLDQMWKEVIASYVRNFDEITLLIKQDSVPYPNRLLSNGILWDIHDFYVQENKHQKAIEIAKLNNTYLDVWREIPE